MTEYNGPVKEQKNSARFWQKLYSTGYDCEDNDSLNSWYRFLIAVTQRSLLSATVNNRILIRSNDSCISSGNGTVMSCKNVRIFALSNMSCVGNWTVVKSQAYNSTSDDSTPFAISGILAKSKSQESEPAATSSTFFKPFVWTDDGRAELRSRQCLHKSYCLLSLRGLVYSPMSYKVKYGLSNIPSCIAVHYILQEIVRVVHVTPTMSILSSVSKL